MRGEHFEVPFYDGTFEGSSPHARGARSSGRAWRLRSGLIPACAGSTCEAPAGYVSAAAHPRMRGEHFISTPTAPTASGSSPHARGARGVGVVDGGALRLIPACAGSTRAIRPACRSSTAHPRMRGEHYCRKHPAAEYRGSSPHARGALLGQRVDGVGDGLIPACAGSTSPKLQRSSASGAHPRMRGEHAATVKFLILSQGSSPHARGARTPGSSGGFLARLIPACAGSTTRSQPGSSMNPAHPRMRGEHSRAPLILPLRTGSSPHARGAQVHLRRHDG